MYYNIAQRVMQEALGQNGIYGEVSRYCLDVQQILNKEAEIGINAMTPELKQDRIDGIVDIVSGKDDFDKIKYMLKEPLINLGQSIVDEAVRSNADFQHKAGLSFLKSSEHRREIAANGATSWPVHTSILM